ncbi:MAG: hypothetical protein SP1CHLAM54_09490 [Chlamydiia bacterium]|nr:hypothetical protein [Chlamydiia bacterium]MCH9615855.1 hypothetical protein [Chlamydiia bacterium]MCH9628742.1 hypothetical protein [Chlamydiia bacterium]
MAVRVDGGGASAGVAVEGLGRICDFSFYYYNSVDDIAAELKKVGADSRAVLDFLLDQNCDVKVLAGFIEAFTLEGISPFNRVRLQIIDDDEHVLTNAVLDGLEDGEKVACYELAFLRNHPGIYQEAVPVAVEDYSVNLLWVNLNPQDRVADLAGHIFGDGVEKDVNEAYRMRLSSWADKHPGGSINLWYDSALVTEKARMGTLAMLEEMGKEKGVSLRLRDVRLLPNIPPELRHALHPGAPVYFRVDMLKVLIADYMISSPEERERFFVFTDVDVEVLEGLQLFNQRTMRHLEKMGYVFNRNGMDKFENSFFMFQKGHEKLLKVHRKKMIEAIVNNIKVVRRYSLNPGLKSEYVMDANFVFNLYRGFREKMDERVKDKPRKVVVCPSSRFNGGGNFKSSDHQKEAFRFVGDGVVPYTRWGRNSRGCGDESPIRALKDWVAAPLI